VHVQAHSLRKPTDALHVCVQAEVIAGGVEAVPGYEGSAGAGRQGVSDGDRERLTSVLKVMSAEGLLTNDEFMERVSRAVTARTQGEIDMVRANIVIASYRTAAWARIRTPEGRPAFRDWAEFCRLGVGVTQDFPIRGAARKFVVKALRSMWEPAQVPHIAAATGYDVRTIQRDVLELGLANENRSNAARRARGGLEDTAVKAATAQTIAALDKANLADVAAYIRTKIPPAELAGLLGDEYVVAMRSK
jgi:hypothetical protein